MPIMNTITTVDEAKCGTNWPDMPAEVRQQILSELLSSVLADIPGYDEAEYPGENRQYEHKKVNAQRAYATEKLKELILVSLVFGQDLRHAGEAVLRKTTADGNELKNAQAGIANSLRKAAPCSSPHPRNRWTYYRTTGTLRVRLCEGYPCAIRKKLWALLLEEENLDRARINTKIRIKALAVALKTLQDLGERRAVTARERAGEETDAVEGDGAASVGFKKVSA